MKNGCFGACKVKTPFLGAKVFKKPVILGARKFLKKPVILGAKKRKTVIFRALNSKKPLF